MNKFKKIGLTALAGSLVATSAFAAEWTVSGGASIGVSNITGSADAATGKDWSMGNEINFSGSGELDNGMSVTVAFQLDQGAGAGVAATADSGKPFDDHSITIASDTFGTLKLSGHGGSSAHSAMATMASGDVWNQTMGVTGMGDAVAGDDSLFYTLPEVMDGVKIDLSVSPGRAAQETHTSYAVTYTGIEGLSLSFGRGDSGAPGAVAEHSAIKGSYAFGPITVGASSHEDDNAGATADVDGTSYSVAYTISEDLSVSYGTDTFDKTGTSVDQEAEGITVSYTAGGMTISASQYEVTGGGYVAGAKSDKWALGASFAF